MSSALTVYDYGCFVPDLTRFATPQCEGARPPRFYQAEREAERAFNRRVSIDIMQFNPAAVAEDQGTAHDVTRIESGHRAAIARELLDIGLQHVCQ